MGMGQPGARLPTMATNYICITTPSPSPISLHLQNSCQESSELLATFPIVIHYNSFSGSLSLDDEDTLIAALEHSHRVCVLNFYATTTQLVKPVAVMQQPYPALTHLTLKSDLDAQVIPGGFLGRSAPGLQELWLEATPFPALPILLLSARELVELHLNNIPKTGYISPGAMVVGLAALTSLRTLFIGFRSSASFPDQTCLPLTRTVLPALTSFAFQGISDNLEDLVGRIDCPRVNDIDIHYLRLWRDGLQVAELFEFINRSEDPF